MIGDKKMNEHGTFSPSKALGQRLRAIEELDLAPIKLKLMELNDGPAWTREQVDRMEIKYKRFLILCLKYPERQPVPSKEIDTFWHQHILDTLKYAEDCQTVFGYFLHHFPYFGMRGEEDRKRLEETFSNTKKLYRDEFGIELEPFRAECHEPDPEPEPNPPACHGNFRPEGLVRPILEGNAD